MLNRTPSLPKSKVVAKRGNQWLSLPALEAHLAALLRIEHAAVLLGSGASIGPLGGKTMSEAWSEFEELSKSSYDWLVSESFVTPNVAPNIEELLDAVEICRLESVRSNSPKLADVSRAHADLRRALIRAAVLKPNWLRSGIPDAEIIALRDHRLLLQKLCGARQPGQSAPWVFTTNYDLAIEWAAESLGLSYINGFSGLHDRRFSPHNFDLGYRNVLARGEARFGIYNFYLAKLHGSLTWVDTDKAEIREQSATAVWPTIEAFINNSSDQLSGVMALPGASKYVATSGFVMGELFRRFTDFIARPQAMLLVNGYSCSDDHLNRLLLTALQNPTLQMVLYARSASKTSDTLTVAASRRWIKMLADLALPQVTVVFGEAATFEGMVSQLPDPAVYDERAFEIKKLLLDSRTDSE